MTYVTGPTRRGLPFAASAIAIAVVLLANVDFARAQTSAPAPSTSSPAAAAVATPDAKPVEPPAAVSPTTAPSADSAPAMPPAFPTAPAATAAQPSPPVQPDAQTATTSPATAQPPAATAPEATGAVTPAVAVPSAPIVPPDVEAARASIKGAASGRTAHADDVAAANDFYATRQSLVWINDGAYSLPAQSLIAELRKADDYGLDAAAFAVANVSSSSTPAEKGAADANLTLAALKYARFARGGRLDPVSLSSMLDVQPSIKDPIAVLKDVTSSATPDLVIRALHPKHPEFEGLRQALIKARGPRQDEAAAIDPALLVKLPPGKTLKAGVEHDDVTLLRKRLKVAVADGTSERAFSPELADALKSFQETQGIKPNGH